MLDFARISSQNCSSSFASDVTRHTDPNIETTGVNILLPAHCFLSFLTDWLHRLVHRVSLVKLLNTPVGVSKPESNNTVPLESNPVEHPVWIRVTHKAQLVLHSVARLDSLSEAFVHVRLMVERVLAFSRSNTVGWSIASSTLNQCFHHLLTSDGIIVLASRGAYQHPSL